MPTSAELTELEATTESLKAEFEAFGEPPTEEAERALRRASVPLLDAMRLISPRHPEAAAPEIRRQLAPMLPAHPNTPEVVERAIKQAAKDYDELRHTLRWAGA